MRLPGITNEYVVFAFQVSGHGRYSVVGRMEEGTPFMTIVKEGNEIGSYHYIGGYLSKTLALHCLKEYLKSLLS